MPSTSPTLINQEQFDLASAKWLDIVSSNPDALNACFNPAGQFSVGATLPVQTVIYLLSAIGTVAIKAQFIVQSEGDPAFTIVLYGTDSLGTRTTAYFVADISSIESVDNSILADCIGSQWLNNWQALDGATITSALFDSAYGLLQAYIFPMEDFMDVLLPLGPEDVDNVELNINFALHIYYCPKATEAKQFTSTFGLALNLASTSGTPLPAAITALFYDISKPCPPAS